MDTIEVSMAPLLLYFGILLFIHVCCAYDMSETNVYRMKVSGFVGTVSSQL